MRKLRLIFVCLLVVSVSLTNPVFAEKVAVLPEVLKPGALTADSKHIYITEDTTIFIYSLTDFKLIKKFGKRGEGPQEFMTVPGLTIMLNAQTDDLIVNSLGKISFFTKEGVFKREQKVIGPSFALFPLGAKGEQFIGMGINLQDNIRYRVINIFDADLKKIKEIYRTRDVFQQGGDIKVLQKSFAYMGYKGKIFVAGKEEFVIDVLDNTGKLLYTIGPKNYKRPEVTEQDKKNLFEAMRTNPQTKPYFQILKDRIKFPPLFPAIAAFTITGDRVYVLTFKKEGENFEFYIFGIDGKFRKSLFMPLQMIDTFQPYPFAIYGQKMYQVVEGEDGEDCELHVTEIN